MFAKYVTRIPAISSSFVKHLTYKTSTGLVGLPVLRNPRETLLQLSNAGLVSIQVIVASLIKTISNYEIRKFLKLVSIDLLWKDGLILL